MSVFNPLNINKNTIKNRLVVPPLSDNQAERNGQLSQQQFDSFMKLAKKGAGTIIIDSAYVCQQGRGLAMQLGISEEKQTPGLKNLVRLLKEEGVFVGLRISHAGAKTSNRLCGETPIGPSPIHFGKEYDPCREFDEHDVKEVCTFFGHAAERAEEIGMNFIEINGAQSLLIDQCLSPALNLRDDAYGGDVAGRMKFAVEVIRSVKKRISNNLLISFFFNSPLDREDEDLGSAELLAILKILESEKINILHPNFNNACSRLVEADKLAVKFITENCSLPMMIEGSIKSTIMLKELNAAVDGSLFCIDKTLLQRHNWLQFIHKKLNP